MKVYYVSSLEEFIVLLKKYNPRELYVYEGIIDGPIYAMKVLKLGQPRSWYPIIIVRRSLREADQVEKIVNEGLRILGYKPVEILKTGNSIWIRYVKEF